jgi:hypothetical protein
MPGAGLYLPGVHLIPARAGELARLCSYQFTTDLRSFQARFTDLPGSCAPDAVYVVGGSPGIRGGAVFQIKATSAGVSP